jgi:hypothetical protein
MHHPLRHRLAVGLAAPAAAVAALAALACLPAPAPAAEGAWTCEAHALTGTVLTTSIGDPAAANPAKPACVAAQTSGEAALAPLANPALPNPLAVSALSAKTTLTGPDGAPQQQVAAAEGGLADLRVSALPGLPIALPLPDLSQYAKVALPIPGAPAIDLRPALQALAAQQLPNVDLLHVTLARARASVSCVNGAPTMTGSSTLASAQVGGRDIGLERATTETVRLIDSQTLDPAAVDPAKIVGLPPGVGDAVLRPVLEQLPDVAVPPTVARLKLTPGEQLRSGTRLTQRALHAEISIAGRSLADLVVGEATVGSAGVSCGGVADLALECTARRIVLIDVYEQRGRVRLIGAADRRYAGRRVRIRLTADGSTVARPKVRRDGQFTATAKLPAEAIRFTNDARYQAAIGGDRSMKLKLMRRMLVTQMRSRGGKVTIAGAVVRPLGSPVQTVTVKRRVSCRRWQVVKRFKPGADGRFHVTLTGPRKGEAAVYRMTTRVRRVPAEPKLFPTFTLPRYVDLA